MSEKLSEVVNSYQAKTSEIPQEEFLSRVSLSSLNSPVHVRRTVESVPGGVIAAPIPAMPYRDRGTPF